MKIKKNIIQLSSFALLSSLLIACTGTIDTINNPSAPINASTTDQSKAQVTEKLNYIVTSFNAKISKPTDSNNNLYKVTLSSLPADGLEYMSQSHQADEGNMSYAAFDKLWHSKDPNSFMSNNPNGRITLSGTAADKDMTTIIGKIKNIAYNKKKNTLEVTIEAFDGFNNKFNYTKSYSFASLFIDEMIDPF